MLCAEGARRLFNATHEVLFDFHGGLPDVSAGLLRTVGDPRDAMAEDAARTLRGMRFAARLGFRVHPATEKAMR